MNIVEMLKEQLKGDVGKTLAGMIGGKGKDLEKILATGLPSLLSGLGTIASSKAGADKIAASIGSLGDIDFSDIGSLLDSEAKNDGSKMLGGFFGGEVLDGIIELIAKFTGVQSRVVKKAMSSLTPVVMATLASTFQGTKPDGTAIAKLFDDQKENIAGSLPDGFSLDAIPGFKDLALASSAVGDAASKVGGGIGQLLIPVAVIAAIIAAVFFFVNNAEKANGRMNKVGNAPEQRDAEPTKSATKDSSTGTEIEKESK